MLESFLWDTYDVVNRHGLLGELPKARQRWFEDGDLNNRQRRMRGMRVAPRMNADPGKEPDSVRRQLGGLIGAARIAQDEGTLEAQY